VCSVTGCLDGFYPNPHGDKKQIALWRIERVQILYTPGGGGDMCRSQGSGVVDVQAILAQRRALQAVDLEAKKRKADSEAGDVSEDDGGRRGRKPKKRKTKAAFSDEMDDDEMLAAVN